MLEELVLFLFSVLVPRASPLYKMSALWKLYDWIRGNHSFYEPYVQGSMDQVLRKISQEDSANARKHVRHLHFWFLNDDLRYYYVVTKPTKFSFRSHGNLISGTIPAGFVVDGFTFPLYGFLQTLIDTYYWRRWLIHDYLYTFEPVWINGIKRKLTVEEINSVFQAPFEPLLNTALSFVQETNQETRAILSLLQKKPILMKKSADSRFFL